MTVKDFLEQTTNINRVDIIAKDGFVLDMNATAISILKYIDKEIIGFEFDTRVERTSDGKNIEHIQILATLRIADEKIKEKTNGNM